MVVENYDSKTAELQIQPSGERQIWSGENGYNLSKIRARAAKTSESWIAAIFLVMNLVKFSKEFLFSFLKVVLGSLFSIPNIFVHRPNENIAFKI